MSLYKRRRVYLQRAGDQAAARHSRSEQWFFHSGNDPAALLARGRAAAALIAVGSTLYFVGTDLTYGAELWKSDGTTDGTEIVRDIDPGTNGSTQNDPMVADGSTIYLTPTTGRTATNCGRAAARRRPRAWSCEGWAVEELAAAPPTAAQVSRASAVAEAKAHTRSRLRP